LSVAGKAGACDNGLDEEEIVGAAIVPARRPRRAGSSEAIEAANAETRDANECARWGDDAASVDLRPVRYSWANWRRRPSPKRSWLC
jgi:hypothetical protein